MILDLFPGVWFDSDNISLVDPPENFPYLVDENDIQYVDENDVSYISP